MLGKFIFKMKFEIFILGISRFCILALIICGLGLAGCNKKFQVLGMMKSSVSFPRDVENTIDAPNIGSPSVGENGSGGSESINHAPLAVKDILFVLKNEPQMIISPLHNDCDPGRIFLLDSDPTSTLGRSLASVDNQLMYRPPLNGQGIDDLQMQGGTLRKNGRIYYLLEGGAVRPVIIVTRPMKQFFLTVYYS